MAFQPTDQKPVAGCAICDVLDNNQDNVVVFETDLWRVSLADDQRYLGRAYMTLLRHAPDLPSLTDAERAEYWDIICLLENLYKSRLNASHVTYAWLMNNAYREPDPKPHVHGHIRPRYAQAVTVAGREWRDLEFGEHHTRNTSVVPTSILREIRDVLIG